MLSTTMPRTEGCDRWLSTDPRCSSRVPDARAVAVFSTQPTSTPRIRQPPHWGAMPAPSPPRRAAQAPPPVLHPPPGLEGFCGVGSGKSGPPGILLPPRRPPPGLWLTGDHHRVREPTATPESVSTEASCAETRDGYPESGSDCPTADTSGAPSPVHSQGLDAPWAPLLAMPPGAAAWPLAVEPGVAPRSSLERPTGGSANHRLGPRRLCAHEGFHSDAACRSCHPCGPSVYKIGQRSGGSREACAAALAPR